MCGYIPYLDQTLIVLTGTIELSYCYSLKGNKSPPIGVAMTIQGSLICPVTGTLFMELPELPISNSVDFYTHHRQDKDLYTRHKQQKDFYTRHRQPKICILTMDKISIRQHKILYSLKEYYLYSPQTTHDFILATDTQDSILATDNTKISMLITDNTKISTLTQDLILNTHNTIFYTRHEHKIFILTTHKIFILATDNTKISIFATDKISILATDNTKILYSPQTTQRYYTRHRQH